MLYTAGTRVTVLCAPGDMWFPDAAYSEMQRGVPGVQVLASLPLVIPIPEIALRMLRACNGADSCSMPRC